MPAYAPQTLSLSLAGSTTPAAWTHWSGNPLTFSVSLTGSTDFTSCTLLRVELHTRRDSAEDGDSLLEYVEEANPASEPTALTFTGAQLNGLIADGSTSRRLWVCVVGYVDGSKYTFGSGWLTLLRDNYSGDSDTAHTPADNNFVTESQLNALAAVLYTAQTLTSDQQTQARTNISAAKSGAVTGSGLTMAGQRLLGRATGGVGALDEIQLGTGLALSGTYLSVLSSYGGQGAADGDMMVQFSADGSITATAGVHLTGDSGYVALYNEGALGVLFNPIDVNSHFGLLERKIALDQDTVWTLPNLSGTVMVGASNLSDVASVATARTNLGLTSLSTTTPGAGIATWLSTPSSANLAAALTDKTGTGAAVFASSPTLVTPILGTPTSGTLTNCTIPASGISTGIIPDDRLYPLRPSSFDGPYDDDFTGSSLDAKWSRQGLVSGDHTYQTANGSWMSMSIAAGATGVIARSIHQTWTPADATILCRLSYSQIGSAYPMMGPFITDASGNGVGVTIYNNGTSFAICVLSGWVFASFALYIAMGLPSHNIATAAGGIWFKLRKSGTTYYAAYSPDGHFWSPEVSAVNATTMTKVGMGTFYRAPGAADYGAYQHFDFFKIS